MSYWKLHYGLKIQRKNNRTLYIVTVLSQKGRTRDVAVTKDVYETIKEFKNQDKHFKNQDERHKEYLSLSEEEIAGRGGAFAPSAEDVALHRMLIEELKDAFLQLPPVQARRYLLVHALGLSYAEVALKEGCSKSAVKHSLVLAKKNLQTIFQNRLPETPSE